MAGASDESIMAARLALCSSDGTAPITVRMPWSISRGLVWLVLISLRPRMMAAAAVDMASWFWAAREPAVSAALSIWASASFTARAASARRCISAPGSLAALALSSSSQSADAILPADSSCCLAVGSTMSGASILAVSGAQDRG